MLMMCCHMQGSAFNSLTLCENRVKQITTIHLFIFAKATLQMAGKGRKTRRSQHFHGVFCYLSGQRLIKRVDGLEPCIRQQMPERLGWR
ncbi:hypothetical protein B7764_05555 [Pantoea ananatis]|jgi:hypothetical protein|nr:hypothetical protein B7764_05555 [Pantoea ananatis]PQK74073.1 hypothetical protein CG430_16745 [Pantoea ananatis]PQK78363.1 hypothetical protein CG427_02820 [Pantoea ananatis]CCF09038.1 hypothetical protein PANA5342_1645 [Pantoea ananatis LMG 5342]